MSPGGRLRLAVLISGKGSNMAAIAESCAQQKIAADITLVLSDRAAAGGLAIARERALPTQLLSAEGFAGREQYDSALRDALDASGSQLVVLAGFMRILSAPFVQHFAGRLINIHPSLLPNYKGLHTHRRVLDAGEPEHGASVHFVSAELDGGPVIAQARVPVLAGDTEQSLSARVQVAEHKLYPWVVGLIAAGRVRLDAGHVSLDGQTLSQPVSLSNDTEEKLVLHPR